MKNRFYVDTSVWSDYFGNRSDGIRPLGEFAFQFLRRCQKNKWAVLVSPEVEKELLAYYPKEQVDLVFSTFRDIIVKVSYSKEQISEAFSFWAGTRKEFPFSDILHSVIARDSHATLVCRDRHFFEMCLVDCVLPEEVD